MQGRSFRPRFLPDPPPDSAATARPDRHLPLQHHLFFLFSTAPIFAAKHLGSAAEDSGHEKKRKD
jgi:hypothetical protein